MLSLLDHLHEDIVGMVLLESPEKLHWQMQKGQYRK